MVAPEDALLVEARRSCGRFREPWAVILHLRRPSLQDHCRRCSVRAGIHGPAPKLKEYLKAEGGDAG